MKLQEFFEEHPAAAIAFSGGADSAYLLAEALRAGCRVRPYFVKGPFQPAFELEDARRLCAQLGAELTVLAADPLADPEVVAGAIIVKKRSLEHCWPLRGPTALPSCGTAPTPRTTRRTAPG